MEPPQFAQLLGVHPSTLYRWESMGAAPVRVEPLQLQLLTVLEQQIEHRPAPARADLSKAILTGLFVGGGLLGLYCLLNAAYGEQRPPRRHRTASAPSVVPPRGDEPEERRDAPRRRGVGPA